MRHLFEHHSTLRAVIDAVLERRVGQIVQAGEGVARLDVGCYAVFGGDPTTAKARRLVADIEPPVEIVVGDDARWPTLFRSVWGAALSARPMQVFELPDTTRSRRLLRRAAGKLDGSGVEIREFDLQLAAQLDDGVQPHALQVYGTPSAFLEGGLGVAAVEKGKVVAAATTYTLGESRAEIAIATRETHRRRGLAEVAAATLCSICLDRGVRPEWSASNPVSQRLAARLGYRRVGRCEILFCEAE